MSPSTGSRETIPQRWSATIRVRRLQQDVRTRCQLDPTSPGRPQSRPNLPVQPVRQRFQTIVHPCPLTCSSTATRVPILANSAENDSTKRATWRSTRTSTQVNILELWTLSHWNGTSPSTTRLHLLHLQAPPPPPPGSTHSKSLLLHYVLYVFTRMIGSIRWKCKTKTKTSGTFPPSTSTLNRRMTWRMTQCIESFSHDPIPPSTSTLKGERPEESQALSHSHMIQFFTWAHVNVVLLTYSLPWRPSICDMWIPEIELDSCMVEPQSGENLWISM